MLLQHCLRCRLLITPLVFVYLFLMQARRLDNMHTPDLFESEESTADQRMYTTAAVPNNKPTDRQPPDTFVEVKTRCGLKKLLAVSLLGYNPIGP